MSFIVDLLEVCLLRFTNNTYPQQEISLNKAILSLAALALFGISGSAHAATLDVFLGTLSTNLSYSASAANLNPDIHLTSPAPASLSLSNAQIINPASSSAGNYLDLMGNLFDNNYLAVFGTSGNVGQATFTLAANQNVFGFSWGSIDDYNTLTITDSRNVTYTLSGADILAHIGNPVPGNQASQTDVSFVDPFGSIVSVKLGSTQNAFEAGNFSSSATPLPGSVVLFGTALMALAAFAYKRQQAKA
jgi:hypothetical protein